MCLMRDIRKELVDRFGTNKPEDKKTEKNSPKAVGFRLENPLWKFNQFIYYS